MKILLLAIHATLALAIGYRSRPQTSYNDTAPPYAVGYAALTDEGLCKSEGRVWADIGEMQDMGIQAVSIEGITCDQHELVSRVAYELGMKVHVSFPVKPEGLGPASLQMGLFVDSFGLAAHWQSVEAVIVGNSAIRNNHVSWMDLENVTWRLKAALKSVGYAGLVSIAEPAETFERFPILCRTDTIDFVALEFWPFYHPEHVHRDSGMLLAGEVMRAESVCSKSVYVVSAGFPSSGETNGNQIASRDRQEQAINLMLTQSRGNLTLQTYFNEPWREEGRFNDLQYYGMRRVLMGGY